MIHLCFRRASSPAKPPEHRGHVPLASSCQPYAIVRTGPTTNGVDFVARQFALTRCIGIDCCPQFAQFVSNRCHDYLAPFEFSERTHSVASAATLAQTPSPLL